MFETVAALLLFLFPLAFSPGPGNLFFAANGARFGFRATIPANMGYHVATLFVTAAIGFGFASIINQIPLFQLVIKWVGSAYVLWIAIKMIRSSSGLNAPKPQPARFVDGAVLLLLNPKAYLIIGVMFSQFLREQSDALMSVLWITGLFTLNNFVAFCLWTYTGDRLAQLMGQQENARRMNLAMGGLLAFVAIWMMLG